MTVGVLDRSLRIRSWKRLRRSCRKRRHGGPPRTTWREAQCRLAHRECGFSRGFSLEPGSTAAPPANIGHHNRGTATAADVLRLAREVRDGVKQRFGIDFTLSQPWWAARFDRISSHPEHHAAVRWRYSANFATIDLVSNRRIRAVIVAAIAFCVAAIRWPTFGGSQPRPIVLGRRRRFGEYPALTAARVLIPRPSTPHLRRCRTSLPGRFSKEREPIPGAPEGARMADHVHVQQQQDNPVAVTGYYAEPTLPPAQSKLLIRFRRNGSRDNGSRSQMRMSQAPLESGTRRAMSTGTPSWSRLRKLVTRSP